MPVRYIVQPLNLQGQKNREVVIGIDLERMHAARQTPLHELPRGLSLDEMREHILAVAKKAK